MKKSSSYMIGVVPWIFAVSVLGFLTRFGVLGKTEHSPHINYVLFAGGAVAVYSLFFILRMCGVRIEGLEYHEPEKNTVLNCFDASAMMAAILLLLMHSAVDLPEVGSAVIMCAVSMTAAVAALIAERSGRIGPESEGIHGSGLGGKLVLGGIFAAVAGIAGLVFYTAFSGVEKVSEIVAGGFQSAGSFILRVLKFCADTILRFLLWIASFFPEEELESLEVPEQKGFDISGAEIPEMTYSVPSWLIISAAVLAAAAVIIYIRKNIRFDGVHVKLQRQRTVKRKSRAGSVFKEFFDRLMRQFLYYVNCVRYRKTPAGLLVYCERHAPKGKKRLAGESGEAYLRRSVSSPEIDELASRLETEFYAEKKFVYPNTDYKRIKKIWNTKVREANIK